MVPRFGHAGTIIVRSALLSVAVGVLAVDPGAVAAQELGRVREVLRRAADDANFADAIQGLTGFAALPGISAANFTVDEDLDGASDARMTKLVLPLAHDFQDLRLAGGALHTELTLSYLKSKQELGNLLPGTAYAADVDTDLRIMSAIGGLGLAFDLGAHTKLRPLALAGYSHIQQDGTFSGPGAAKLEAATDGITLNFDIDEAVFGGAIEIVHERELGHDIGFMGDVRYNYVHARTFAASDHVLETSSHMSVLTAYAQLDGPTGLTALGRQLRWIGFVANSSFPGSSSESLGFDYFFEFGGGIEIVDRSIVSGIDGLSLRGSALAGNGIRGWSVSAKLEF